MPKMKTHRATAKRFKSTKTGLWKREKACKSHLLGKKSSKRKRRLRQPATLGTADRARMQKLLPYS